MKDMGDILLYFFWLGDGIILNLKLYPFTYDVEYICKDTCKKIFFLAWKKKKRSSFFFRPWVWLFVFWKVIILVDSHPLI